jgi:hypothetical protein
MVGVDGVSLAPLHEGGDIYLVLDELSTYGRVWRELPEEHANEQCVLAMIADGEFHRPMRIIVFNTNEGWSRDDTVDIGFKLLQMSHAGRVLGNSGREFVERTTGHAVTLIA